MRTRRFLVTSLVAAMSVLVLLVVFGGPKTLPPMASIRDPFRGVDFSDLPALSRFAARDGVALAYHAYPASASNPLRGSVVLVHGSSSRSDAMHVVARALAEAGFEVHSLDMRGHGQSGARGDIDYVGQLEDDVEDFLKSVDPPRPRVLVGFSSGGGFALRFAADKRQALFDRYVLLSPFIHQDAASFRANAGGWVSTGIPRYVTIALLDAIGVKLLNDLPVTTFALSEKDKASNTPSYSYDLAVNFRPRHDFRSEIKKVHQPLEIVAGQDDEVFRADKFPYVFEEAGRPAPVTLVPGVNHVGLTLFPQAIRAVVAAVGRT